MLLAPPPYILRPMTLGDVPTVLAIERASFPTPREAHFFTHELSDNPLAHYQVLARRTTGGQEEIVGHAGFWLITGQAHVVTIAVAPNARGQGLGELLLLNLLMLVCAAAPSSVTLEVRESNRVAQVLYLKYRFETVGRRRGYYRDTGEDAVVMRVDLAAVRGYCTWLDEQAAALFERMRRADVDA